jgi:hypothetical protein
VQKARSDGGGDDDQRGDGQALTKPCSIAAGTAFAAFVFVGRLLLGSGAK